MAFIPAENIIKVELFYLWDDQNVENIIYFDSPGGVSEVTIDDLLLLIIDLWDTEWQPDFASELSLVGLKGTDLTEEGSFVVENFTGLPLAGAVGTASVPNNSSLVIKFLTPQSGRSFRGRNYLPGIADANTVGSTEFAAGALAAYLLNYLFFFDAPFSPDFIWGVLSLFTEGAPRTTGLFTPITEVGGDVFIDSQRRRLAGRGT